MGIGFCEIVTKITAVTAEFTKCSLNSILGSVNIRLFNFELSNIGGLTMTDNLTVATHIFDHSKKLGDAYEKVMQPLCKKLDMPQTALDVLMFLANNPGFDTAGDICRYRNIKAALVSFHVEKLVEAGFIERRAVEGDRRKCRLVCTEKAEPVIEEGRQMQKKFAHKLVDGFSEEDMEHFRKCIHIVSGNIDNILKGCL